MGFEAEERSFLNSWSQDEPREFVLEPSQLLQVPHKLITFMLTHTP